ncbi:MAG TPA: hypothetical protein VGE94_00435 [Chloroflexota bacterium]|jgi:hypothetical protein
MSQPHAPTDDRHGPHYEIRLQGHLDSRWAAWFDGLLGKVRDLGLPLIAVLQVDRQ